MLPQRVIKYETPLKPSLLSSSNQQHPHTATTTSTTKRGGGGGIRRGGIANSNNGSTKEQQYLNSLQEDEQIVTTTTTIHSSTTNTNNNNNNTCSSSSSVTTISNSNTNHLSGRMIIKNLLNNGNHQKCNWQQQLANLQAVKNMFEEYKTTTTTPPLKDELCVCLIKLVDEPHPKVACLAMDTLACVVEKANITEKEVIF